MVLTLYYNSWDEMKKGRERGRRGKIKEKRATTMRGWRKRGKRKKDEKETNESILKVFFFFFFFL